MKIVSSMNSGGKMSGSKSFTSASKGGIIFNVKVKGLVTSALAVVCSAAIISAKPLTVYAAYPDDFECNLYDTYEDLRNGLIDYAIDYDADTATSTYVFASDNTIYVIEDDGEERKHEKKQTGSTIDKIEFFEGELYVKILSGTYVYPNFDQPVEFDNWQSGQLSVTVKDEQGNDEQYNLAEDGLHYFCGLTHNNLNDGLDEGFENLKTYGGEAYAIMGKCVYRLNGGAPEKEKRAEKVDTSYIDYKLAEGISTGNAAAALKAPDYEVTTADMRKGSYFTQVDPDSIDDPFFKPLGTQKAEGQISCLILGEIENFYIVTIDNKCYITAKASIENQNKPTLKNDWGNKLAYAREDIGVYASPFICESTKIATLKSGSSHAVKVLEQFTDFSNTLYYRISYEEEDESGAKTAVSGFVEAGYLMEYSFSAEDNKDRTPVGEEPVYDTNVTSVILAIVIVALVIIAIMYLFLVSSKKNNGGKKHKAKKSKQRKKELEEDEDSEE